MSKELLITRAWQFRLVFTVYVIFLFDHDLQCCFAYAFCICIGYDQKINHCLRLYWSKDIVIVFFFPSVLINNRYYH